MCGPFPTCSCRSRERRKSQKDRLCVFSRVCLLISFSVLAEVQMRTADAQADGSHQNPERVKLGCIQSECWERGVHSNFSRDSTHIGRLDRNGLASILKEAGRRVVAGSRIVIFAFGKWTCLFQYSTKKMEGGSCRYGGLVTLPAARRGTCSEEASAKREPEAMEYPGRTYHDDKIVCARA
jgi:hypothetical protein